MYEIGRGRDVDQPIYRADSSHNLLNLPVAA